MNGITIIDGARGEYVRALGPATKDHARVGVRGWMRSKRQAKEGVTLWAIGRNRPHATEQGKPFFVFCQEDSPGQKLTLYLLTTTRSALTYKCSMFDATVIKRAVVEADADPEDVAQVTLELRSEAEERETQSHLQSMESDNSMIVDTPINDHLTMVKAALRD